MPTTALKVLADALGLPPEERADLVARLIRSLDDGPDEDPKVVAAAWAGELERRAARIAAGTGELVSWDEFRATIEADLKAHREALGR